KREGGRIILSPDATSVNLTWKKKEVEPLSFEKAVKDYKEEYAKRYREFIAGGNTPIVVEAPKLLSKEEREIEFKTLYSPQVQGIAYKKPVKTSGPHEEGHPPQLAVDGNVRDQEESSWWAAPPLPKWLEVDLEKEYNIGAIQVFPYWDGSRYYQYTVETSTDGKEWNKVIDMSANTKASTSRGDYHKIAPQKARHVRVNMIYNSANPSVHLVEVRVFEAK
ncbi:discoidin domain-containing protein, partial [Candidatus Sumerlaeota bacterium]|nr:discoidin domain-containing protein [Candidatus Sumerlaeota bacterium]